MPTTADLIAETRQHVYGSERQQLNALNADLTTDGTTVTLQFPDPTLASGHVISVGLEVMYVWTVDPASQTCTVQRGWQGSIQAAHSTGDLATVNPRFTDFEVLRALNRDLADLSAPTNGLYQIRYVDLTAVSGREGYDFPADGFLSIAEIQWQVPNTQTQQWRRVTDYTVKTDLPTSVFPSGQALFLNGQLPTAQQDVRVRYRAAFSPLGNLNDDVVGVTGIPGTAVDLPPMGAALSIMAGRPIGRSQYDAQGDTRRATEVSTSDVVQAPAALRALRQSRIAAEATRLGQLWPSYTRSRDLMWMR